MGICPLPFLKRWVPPSKLSRVISTQHFQQQQQQQQFQKQTTILYLFLPQKRLSETILMLQRWNYLVIGRTYGRQYPTQWDCAMCSNKIITRFTGSTITLHWPNIFSKWITRQIQMCRDEVELPWVNSDATGVESPCAIGMTHEQVISDTVKNCAIYGNKKQKIDRSPFENELLPWHPNVDPVTADPRFYSGCSLHVSSPLDSDI